MGIRVRMIWAAVVLVVTILAGSNCRAQAMAFDEIKTQADMDKTSAALDAELFDAYNKCDLVKFKSLLADDVEFFHDKGGVTLGAQALTDSVKKNICGRVSRELVAGTLQTHHMDGYGILQQGVHRFHHPGHDDTEGVGKGSSSRSGSTKMALGRSRGRSVSTITLRRSNVGANNLSKQRKAWCWFASAAKLER